MKNNKKSISAEEDTAKSYLMNIEKYKAMIDTKCKQYRELEKYSNLIGYKNLTNIFSANTGISRKTEDKAQKKSWFINRYKSRYLQIYVAKK